MSNPTGPGKAKQAAKTTEPDAPITNNVFKSSLLPKEEPFLNADLEYRLLCVQTMLAEQKVDGLLVINGADSLRNPENTKITNFLFKGVTGHDLWRHAEFDPDFTESMMMITPTQLCLFIESKAFNKIRTVVLSLDTPYVFVPQGDILTNQDLLENYKIREFYRFVYDKPTIGVLMTPEEAAKGPKASVEMWPIIQAYGIDGVGSGFFTMKHNVVCLREKLHQIYKRFDGRSKRVTLRQVAPRLVNSAEILIKRLNNARQRTKATDMDQEELSEAFQDIFEMGELGRGKPIEPEQRPKLGLLYGVIKM